MIKRVVLVRVLGIIVYLGLFSMLTIPLIFWLYGAIYFRELILAAAGQQYLSWSLLLGAMFVYGVCLVLSVGAFTRLLTSRQNLFPELRELMILFMVPLSVCCIAYEYLQLSKSLPNSQHFIIYGAMFFMFAIAVNLSVFGILCKRSLRCLQYVWAIP